MLEGELRRAGYKIVVIDKATQIEANAGLGYLFNHNEIAAKLGKNAEAVNLDKICQEHSID